MTGWSEQDKKAYDKFGQVPKKTAFMKKKLQGKEKQRFDSADFEMQKKQGKNMGAVVSCLLAVVIPQLTFHSVFQAVLVVSIPLEERKHQFLMTFVLLLVRIFSCQRYFCFLTVFAEGEGEAEGEQ